MPPLLQLGRMRQAFRLAVLVGAGVGAATLVVAGVLGSPMFGLATCIGLGLGAANAWMTMRAAARVTEAGRRRSLGGVLGRLAAVTVIALGVVVLMGRPGLGALAGLIVFQFLMLFATGRELLSGMREGGSP